MSIGALANSVADPIFILDISTFEAPCSVTCYKSD